jgi:glycogen synthase
MKILLSSHFFHPGIGGIEQVSLTLAREFAKAGHEVKVVTTSREQSRVDFPFEIIRRPGTLRLIRLVQWCDVFFHSNISLQTAWPLLIVRKPWVVAHHTWIARINGRLSLRDRIKHFVIRYAANISVSKAVADHLAVRSVIIGNPYRDDVFKTDPAASRQCELVFLGRLVCDKGLDLLMGALKLLREEKITPRLTVIGDGPERAALEAESRKLNLYGQIDFTGTRTGADLVALLNRHRVIVVPSRWQEPFGLVALEGIACGCVPVVAECGGLPDAIGEAGVTFPCDDIGAMSGCIKSLLHDESALEKYRALAAEHLRNHCAEAVAKKYLHVLAEAAQ